MVVGVVFKVKRRVKGEGRRKEKEEEEGSQPCMHA